MFPLILRTQLTTDDIAAIRAYADAHAAQFGALSAEFWDGRVINADKISDSVVRDKLIANRNFLKAELAARTAGITDEPLYGDTLQIVRWLPGYELQPHADRENPDGSPHPYPWRDFAAITFLNDDFDGGRLYFPKREQIITPEPGTAIIFPGSVEFLHGVTAVTAGVRYTLASFLTHAVDHADNIDKHVV